MSHRSSVAKQTARVLLDNKLFNKLFDANPVFTFYSSGNISVLYDMVNAVERELGFALNNKTFFENFSV